MRAISRITIQQWQTTWSLGSCGGCEGVSASLLLTGKVRLFETITVLFIIFIVCFLHVRYSALILLLSARFSLFCDSLEDIESDRSLSSSLPICEFVVGIFVTCDVHVHPCNCIFVTILGPNLDALVRKASWMKHCFVHFRSCGSPSFMVDVPITVPKKIKIHVQEDAAPIKLCLGFLVKGLSPGQRLDLCALPPLCHVPFWLCAQKQDKNSLVLSAVFGKQWEGVPYQVSHTWTRGTTPTHVHVHFLC